MLHNEAVRQLDIANEYRLLCLFCVSRINKMSVMSFYFTRLQSWSIVLLKINSISLIVSVMNNSSSRPRPCWMKRGVKLDLLPGQSSLILQVDLEELLEVPLVGHAGCSLMEWLVLSTARILPESQTEETMASEKVSGPFRVVPKSMSPVLGHVPSPVALLAVVPQQGGAGVPGCSVPLDSCLSE